MEGFSNYEKEVRPWGNFERFTLNEPSTVKIITVNPGAQLSLQQHAHRDEEWLILQGSGEVTLDERVLPAQPGDNFFVKRGMRHRVKAGQEGMAFLEIAFGQFDEADITRLQDDYGRA